MNVELQCQLTLKYMALPQYLQIDLQLFKKLTGLFHFMLLAIFSARIYNKLIDY